MDHGTLVDGSWKSGLREQEKWTSLEIITGHQTLTNGNAILSDGTFLPSGTMIKGEL